MIKILTFTYVLSKNAVGGMVGSVVSGVASKITGAVEFIGSVKANGKVIDNTHTHGGVQHGGSNTDEVN